MPPIAHRRKKLLAELPDRASLQDAPRDARFAQGPLLAVGEIAGVATICEEALTRLSQRYVSARGVPVRRKSARMTSGSS